MQALKLILNSFPMNQNVSECMVQKSMNAFLTCGSPGTGHDFSSACFVAHDLAIQDAWYCVRESHTLRDRLLDDTNSPLACVWFQSISRSKHSLFRRFWGNTTFTLFHLYYSSLLCTEKFISREDRWQEKEELSRGLFASSLCWAVSRFGIQDWMLETVSRDVCQPQRPCGTWTKEVESERNVLHCF